MIAVGPDRAGGAGVETAGAAGPTRSGRGAERGLEPHVKRQLEGAGGVGGVIYRRLDRYGVAGVGAEVALALVRGGKSGAPPERSRRMSQALAPPSFGAVLAKPPRPRSPA